MDILKSERPFDLIILSHVLEHLVSPQEMIADILELLSENGLLYIEVPNLLRPFVPMGYFSFEHLNYFTPVSLASIMGANGFSVDFLATFDNSAEVAPFYPVIASTWKKATRSPDPLMNDYDAAFSTVKNYVETSSHAVERLQAKIDLILSKIKPGRLAVWGAGIHTSQLLSLTTLAKADLAFIFDNDPKKHGKFINGIEVVPFMGSPEQIKSHIDAIVISSKASENEIYDQISVVSQR